MSTAIQLAREEYHEPLPVARFSLPDLLVMAKAIAASRLFPDIQNENAALTLMLLCDSEGLHPIQALRRFHVIHGRPAMRADAIQAEFQARGGSIDWETYTNEACEAIFSHPVHAIKPVAIRFTMEDAIRAGLPASNANWKKYPRAQLKARVITEGVRQVMPGVIVGIYSVEEVESFADRPPAPLPAPRPRQEPRQLAPASTSDLPIPGQTNPGQHDPRPYHAVVSEAVLAMNDAWRHRAGPDAAEIVTGPQVHKHLWKAAEKAGHITGDKPTKLGPAISAVVECYRSQREWVRLELGSYLDDLMREAGEKLEAETQAADLEEASAPDDAPFGAEPDDVDATQGGRDG